MSIIRKTIGFPIVGICFSFPSIANSQSSNDTVFLIQMTHSYYAAALCEGVKLDVDGLFLAAKKAGLTQDEVVNIENAIMRLNGNKLADMPPKKISNRVEVASRMISVELKHGSLESWCENRIPNLQQSGILTPDD